MTKFRMQRYKEMPDRVCVVIDNRFDVAIIRTGDGLKIEVYPITDGEPWMDPCARFEVDEDEIRELEPELGDD
jgi:hypothetical protein